MADRTNYAQCLTHLVKGNLGAGILAMPTSFKHTGLIGATLSLPFLCIVSACCVHMLVKCAKTLESKSKEARFSQDQVNYSKLVRGAFEFGPSRTRRLAEFMGACVDTCLLITQIGVCCVYIVFVVDNVTSILASYRILVPKTMVFMAIFPVTLLLSFIRTLARLSVASLLANLLQAIGLALIVEYLLRDFGSANLSERDKFRPLSETALGFGSIMFAFEGISVVLPLYSRMRRPNLMSTCLGVINVSFLLILILYYAMGFLGYLKFGNEARDSITLNLPATPLYDAVRAMFTASILLSYPLQFYVPHEMIWTWAKKNLLKPAKRTNAHHPSSLSPADLISDIKQQRHLVSAGMKQNSDAVLVVSPQGAGKDSAEQKQQQHQQSTTTTDMNAEPDEATTKSLSAVGSDNGMISDEAKFVSASKKMRNLAEFDTEKINNDDNNNNNINVKSIVSGNDINNGDHISEGQLDEFGDGQVPQRYEYYCRLLLVILTFTLAFTVPKLNLLMDLIGSFSGAALSLTIPATIHLVTFWKEKKGFPKVLMIILDASIILGSITAGLGGSLSSLASIVKTFNY